MGLLPIVQGALASGGMNILGGLLGKKDPMDEIPYRKAVEEDRYTWLRDGAKKAGFNPLTVLGAAGQTAGSAVPQTSPFGWKDALADGFRAAGQVLASYDPVADEGRELDNELKKRQILSFDNESRQQGVPGSGADEKTNDSRFENLPPVGEGVGQIDLGSIDAEAFRVDKGRYKNRWVLPWPGSNRTYVMPRNFSPAEGVEGIAGDIGGEAFTFVQAINAGKDTMEELGIKEIYVSPYNGGVHPLKASKDGKPPRTHPMPPDFALPDFLGGDQMFSIRPGSLPGQR